MKLFFLVTGILCSSFLTAQDTLNYSMLVHRLSDMECLATPPANGEESGNFSSYDRKSKYDTVSGTYVRWDANADGSGYIRKEGKDIVIFDKEGPGVIWRFWSALAKEGHIKIFIDNSIVPIVDKPFRDFFETNENEIPPMNYPNLVMTLSRGRNRFLPIPFNQHCKIILEENWGAYYHITYTKFPSKTQIRSFSGTSTRSECFALANADRFLGNRGYETQNYPDSKTDVMKIRVKPGDRSLVKVLMGNKAITGFNLIPGNLPGVADLDKIWLSIKWDTDKNPAVEVPIGMFFGTGSTLHPYRSLPLGIIGNRMYSNWFMPFSAKAEMQIINKSDARFEATFEITSVQLPKPADNMLRFHAQWNDGTVYKRDISNGRDIDWPLLKVSGKGRFCGLTLHVKNEWSEPEKTAETWWYGKWNNKTIDWWWGEGDEKFFVDDEKFPSTFGTGSEDYIGFAWSAEPPFPTFESSFACQPYTPINGNGHTIVNRFHIADNIPFQKSFEASIEKYKKDKWGLNNVCLFDVVTYWYQDIKK